MKNMSSAKLRYVEEKDFAKIAEFLAEGFQSDSLDVWKNRIYTWWVENPSMDPGIPYGWVVEKNVEIVGFFGNIPVKYQINGSEDIALAGMPFYVKPSMRGITGIQLLHAFAKQKNVKLLLNNSPNEASYGIFKKFGFEDFEVPFNGIEYLYIRDYGKMLNFFIKKSVRSQPKLSILKVLLVPTKLISPFIKLIEDKRTHPKKHNNFICSLCSDCDETFAELWHNNRKENSTTLYRDVETLRWLFFSKAFAGRRHVIKCLDSQNNKLVGYFVFDITYKHDAKVMQLKDVYIPKYDEGIIRSVIPFAKILAKKHDVAAVSFWPINEEMNEILKKEIKVKRSNKIPYLYKFVNTEDKDNEKASQSELLLSIFDPNRGVL